ncbi:unnamed protein product, partial [Closterium sp. Naga37s-1]
MMTRKLRRMRKRTRRRTVMRMMMRKRKTKKTRRWKAVTMRKQRQQPWQLRNRQREWRRLQRLLLRSE